MSQKTEEQFIEIMGNFGGKFGLNRALSQVYALLYWKEIPLSLEEISNILKMSKGNVSINIRKLEEWGSVRKIWKRGSNRHYYKANRNIEDFLPQRMRETLVKRIDILKSHLELLLKGAKGKKEKEKIEKVKDLAIKIEEFTNHILNSKITDIIDLVVK